MQDKTINNALLALHKAGGLQGKLAEVLLDMRGVPIPLWYQDRPFKRGDSKRLVISALSERPHTNSELARLVQASRPDISHQAASNRTYQALLRLEAKGVVMRGVGPDGCLWRLAQ